MSQKKSMCTLWAMCYISCSQKNIPGLTTHRKKFITTSREENDQIFEDQTRGADEEERRYRLQVAYREGDWRFVEVQGL